MAAPGPTWGSGWPPPGWGPGTPPGPAQAPRSPGPGSPTCWSWHRERHHHHVTQLSLNQNLLQQLCLLQDLQLNSLKLSLLFRHLFSQRTKVCQDSRNFYLRNMTSLIVYINQNPIKNCFTFYRALSLSPPVIADRALLTSTSLARVSLSSSLIGQEMKCRPLIG